MHWLLLHFSFWTWRQNGGKQEGLRGKFQRETSSQEVCEVIFTAESMWITTFEIVFLFKTTLLVIPLVLSHQNMWVIAVILVYYDPGCSLGPYVALNTCMTKNDLWQWLLNCVSILNVTTMIILYDSHLLGHGHWHCWFAFQFGPNFRAICGPKPVMTQNDCVQWLLNVGCLHNVIKTRISHISLSVGHSHCSHICISENCLFRTV
jgi:hypothetical protein